MSETNDTPESLPEPLRASHHASPLNFGSLTVRPPLVTSGQTIGLLGGSFNPAHSGHRKISLEALKRLNLDRIWWLATPGNPIKSRDDLANLKQRLHQAHQLARHPQIDVTGFEANLPSVYTAQTLLFLKRRFSGVTFIWLMGADNLVTFHKWRHWRTIFDTLPVVVIDRPGYRFSALASPASHYASRFRINESQAAQIKYYSRRAWVYLSVPLSDISSSEIRLAKRSF